MFSRKVAIACAFVVVFVTLFVAGCGEPTSDEKQSQQQTGIVDEIRAMVGMPGIKNGLDLKMLKTIYEKRDQEGLITYTYMKNDMTGKLVFVGESVGYGMPAAAQFSAPHKVEYTSSKGYVTLDQPEPNGVYMPNSAEGTNILMKNPTTGEVGSVYFEDRIDVFPYKLPQ